MAPTPPSTRRHSSAGKPETLNPSKIEFQRWRHLPTMMSQTGGGEYGGGDYGRVLYATQQRGDATEPWTQAAMVTPGQERMEREPGRSNLLGHEAEVTAFAKKLAGDYKQEPFAFMYYCCCLTLTGGYTISDLGDDRFELNGNQVVACCGCIPLENIRSAGGWHASDPSQTITASNGMVTTSTLTNFERTGQIATSAVSGSSRLGPITGTQVVTTTTNNQKYKMGSIAMDIMYKRV